MADDEKTTEDVSQDEPKETESKIETLEDALKELAKVRREAAAKRTKNKELEEAAQKWKEHLDSQKTEFEKLTERAKAAEERSKQLLRDKIVAEYGVGEFADFVVGDTEEELKAKAEKLAAVTKNSSKEESKPDFFAGQRGERVAPKAEDLNDWFAQLWKEVDSTKQRL